MVDSANLIDVPPWPSATGCNGCGQRADDSLLVDVPMEDHSRAASSMTATRANGAGWQLFPTDWQKPSVALREDGAAVDEAGDVAEGDEEHEAEQHDHPGEVDHAFLLGGDSLAAAEHFDQYEQ